MKEEIKEDNQQQNTLKNKTGWKRHFTVKNIIINGLIALLPASLIIGILRELGLGGALIIGSVIFGLMYLVGETREKIKTKWKMRKQNLTDTKKDNFSLPKKSGSKKIIIGLIIIATLILVAFQITKNKLANNNEEALKNIESSEQIIGNLYRNREYKFRIKFPEGWEIKDGDGPNIIKKAVKEGSTVLVYIKDFFEGETELLTQMKEEYIKETGINIPDNEVKQAISELDVNDFSDKEFKEMMSGASEGILSRYKGTKVIDEEIRYISNKKALYIKAEVPYKALDLNIQMINVSYITLYKGNIYMISGASSKESFPIIEKQIIPSITSFVFEDF